MAAGGGGEGSLETRLEDREKKETGSGGGRTVGDALHNSSAIWT